MKIKVKKKEMKNIVKLVDSGNYKPQKSRHNPDAPVNVPSIQIEVQDNGNVFLSARNEDVLIRHRIGAEVDEPGTIAVNNTKLINSIDVFSDEINIESDGETFSLWEENEAGERTEVSVDVIKTSKYDSAPAAEGELLTSSLASKIAYCIRAVLSSIPKKGPHDMLCNLCIDYTDNSIIFIGFNSYHMMRQEAKLNPSDYNTNLDGRKLLIDVAASTCLESVFRKNKNTSKFFVSKKCICISDGEIDFFARLTVGEYPDYSRLLINKYNARFVLSKNGFKEILSSIKGIGNTKEPLPVLFRFNGNKATLRFVTPDSTIVKTMTVEDQEGTLGDFRLLGKSLKDSIPYYGEKLVFLLHDNGIVTIKSDDLCYQMVTSVIR